MWISFVRLRESEWKRIAKSKRKEPYEFATKEATPAG